MRIIATSAVLLAVMMVATAAPIPSSPPVMPLTPSELALQIAEQARVRANQALDAPGTNGLFEALARDAGYDVASAPAAPSESLQSALNRLAVASGMPDVSTSVAEAIHPEWRKTLADLISGLATAAELRNLALVKLSAEDQAALLEWSKTNPTTPHPAMQHVNMPLMLAAGRQATQSIDEAVPRLQSLSSPPGCTVPVANVCVFGATGSCASLPPPLVYAPPLLAIGDTADEGFAHDVVLSIDRAGNDAYCNNAGGTLPSTVNPCAIIFAPVAVLIDLQGHDAYHSSWPAGMPGYGIGTDPSEDVHDCFEGVGVLGVGILTDLAGNDRYSSWKSLQTPTATCPFSPTAVGWNPGLLAQTTQGYAMAGVGLLLDNAGNDDYLSHNVICTEGEAIHVSLNGFQGAGAGVAALRDTGQGADNYASRNTLLDMNRNGLVSTTFFSSGGQASGAVAALLDDGGNDAYLSHNELHDLAASSTAGVSFNTNSVQAIGSGAMLHDRGGKNQFLSHNSLLSTDPAGVGVGSANMLLQLQQAVAGSGTANMTMERTLQDDLISWNWLQGGSASFVLEPTQSAGSGNTVLYSTESASNYLSYNHLESELLSSMVITTAQAVQGGSGQSVFVDRTRGPESDAYNSFNSLVSRGSNALEISLVQAIAPTMDSRGRAIFLDEDASPAWGPYQDYFNSENTVTGKGGAYMGTIKIERALGVIGIIGSGTFTNVDRLGFAWFENRGGADEYNSGNWAGSAVCSFPNAVTFECVDEVHAIASTVPSVTFSVFISPPPPALMQPHAVFIDRDTWNLGVPDTYQPYTSTGFFGEPAGGFGRGMLSTNDGFSNCEDHNDGADLPTYLGLMHGCSVDT